MQFEVMEYELDAQGNITAERVTGEEFLPADDVILAIGQENAFPWIERDLGIQFDKWDVPVIDKTTFQSTRPEVFFGGDAAFGPKNIIWAVEHGHQAAISIYRHAQGEAVSAPGAHGQPAEPQDGSVQRRATPTTTRRWTAPDAARLDQGALQEAQHRGGAGFHGRAGRAGSAALPQLRRADMFVAKLCIECDACIDICPVDCLTITHNGTESDLRARLKAPAKNLAQPLYVSAGLPQTARVMVKDEDLCVQQ